LAKFESPGGNFAKADDKLLKLWQSLIRREEPLPKLTYKLPKLWQSLNQKKADTVFYTMAAC